EHAHEPVGAERLLHAADHELGEERVLLRKEMNALVRQAPRVARPSALRRPHQFLEVAVALESAQVLMHGAPRDAERLGELVGAPALLPYEERRQQRPLPRTQRFDRRDVHAADYPPCWAISNFVNFFLYEVEPSAPVPALMTWRSVRRSNPSPA